MIHQMFFVIEALAADSTDMCTTFTELFHVGLVRLHGFFILEAFITTITYNSFRVVKLDMFP